MRRWKATTTRARTCVDLAQEVVAEDGDRFLHMPAEEADQPR